MVWCNLKPAFSFEKNHFLIKSHLTKHSFGLHFLFLNNGCSAKAPSGISRNATFLLAAALMLVGKAQTNFTLTAATNQLLHWNFNRNKILKAQRTEPHSLLQIFLIKGRLHGHDDYTTQNMKRTVLNSKND